MNSKKTLKIIGSIIATIIIGAIGSGLWEKLLSPAFTYLAGMISRFFASISIGYSNLLYTTASSEPSAGIADAVLSFMLLLSALYLVVSIIITKGDSFRDLFKGKSCVAAGFFFIAFSFSVIILQSSSSNIRYFFKSNMILLRPYIGEEEHHRLRSDFIQVSSEEDFDKILVRMHSHAEKHELELIKPH